MLIFTLVLSALNIILWLFVFAHFRKKFSVESVLREIRVETEKLLIEIQAECDRDISIIDARIKGLKSLMEQADKRIQTAGRAAEFQEKRAASYDAQKTEISERAQKAAELSKTIYSKVIIPKQAAPNVSVAPNEQTETPHKIFAEKTLREKVLSLNAEGLTPKLIAEKLSVSVTEVQIVIDMDMNTKL